MNSGLTGCEKNPPPPEPKDEETRQLNTNAGTTDDGAGTPLDDFISFQIKIVMQGTNTAEPPRIKELRCIALAM